MKYHENYLFSLEPSDHLQSKEYKYMAHMLDEANKKQEELRVSNFFFLSPTPREL